MATILVIDDHSSSRQAVGKLLKLDGHQVIQAANVWQGVGALEVESVDLILLDLEMPGIDGWEFLELTEANARWQSLPVIIVSAVRFNRAQWNAHQGQVREWLIKAEFTGDELLEAVRRHLPHPSPFEAAAN